MAQKHSFEQQCRNEFKKAVDGYTSALHDTLFQCWNEMVRRCPVLTGRLRFGIYLSENIPSDYCPPPAPNLQPLYYPPPTKPTLSNQIEDLYIFGDNVPYADIIEYDGYSRKAPEGFMRISLINFSRYFKENCFKRKLGQA